jgi:hypothetical protein
VGRWQTPPSRSKRFRIRRRHNQTRSVGSFTHARQASPRSEAASCAREASPVPSSRSAIASNTAARPCRRRTRPHDLRDGRGDHVGVSTLPTATWLICTPALCIIAAMARRETLRPQPPDALDGCLLFGDGDEFTGLGYSRASGPSSGTRRGLMRASRIGPVTSQAAPTRPPPQAPEHRIRRRTCPIVVSLP